MPNRRLFKLRLDPDRLPAVRAYFEDLEAQRETFERGLTLEGMNAETAWLDESEPALYYSSVCNSFRPASQSKA